MAREKTLSSDIDFIREFEELKIKQRLLIENLKKKGQANQDKLFLEINSKLDFLVKIFKESNEPTGEGEEGVEAEQDPVSLQIEELTKNFNDKFNSLDEKLEEILVKVKNHSSNSSNASAPKNSSSELPPKPDFEAKIDDVNKSTEKKKKWF